MIFEDIVAVDDREPKSFMLVEILRTLYMEESPSKNKVCSKVPVVSLAKRESGNSTFWPNVAATSSTPLGYKLESQRTILSA